MGTILVEAQNDLTDEETVTNLCLVYKQFREKDVEVLAAIANKASGDLKKLRPPSWHRPPANWEP